MAIRTKLGAKLFRETVRADDECLVDGKILRVWALAEGQHEERLYWLSDLDEDSPGEIQSVLKANSKAHALRKMQ